MAVSPKKLIQTLQFMSAATLDMIQSARSAKTLLYTPATTHHGMA
jgi:hypothetical protein